MKFISMIAFVFLILISVSLAEEDQKFATILGKVSDYEDNLKSGEQILFVNKSTQEKHLATSGKDGTFQINLLCGNTYVIKILGFKDEQEYTELAIPELEENQSSITFELNIQYEPAKEFILQNVYFETAKWDIKDESYPELDMLVEFLKTRGYQLVEIGGHTDNIGDKNSNQTLSQKRAEAIVSYLVSKGISKDKLLAKGYGEDVPITSNESEKGRSQNRRTEVKILTVSDK